MRKSLVYTLYLSLLLSAGCKIRRSVEGESVRQSWSELSGEAARWTDWLRTDTLLQVWQREMKGILTIWSAPDSIGRQYKEAELSLVSQESAEKEQHSYTFLSDTVQMNLAGQQEEIQQETLSEERTRNWRPGIRFLYLLGGGVLCLVSIFLYFRKKK
ncbi:MAG: hypothetical protein LIP01_13180 [Tannerellaceae bacterium]|nr:hypothetical protein [Tannerellaceae bacterium]